MLTCAKCQAAVPQGMRFCLECGAAVELPSAAETPIWAEEPSLSAPAPARAPADPLPAGPVVQESPVPPVSQFRQQRTPASTINLKIAPTPVIAPRFEPLPANARPSLGDNAQEVDDELLKKAFERPVRHQPGAVICRFCKGPLFLGGEFCEHCGAPVAEAAPPGVTLPPRPKAPEPEPEGISDDPLADLLGPAPVAAPAPASSQSITGLHPSVAPMAASAPPARLEPPRPAPRPNPYLSPSRPREEDSPGLMGRLKGIFKKS